jgi:hypothetical protein
VREVVIGRDEAQLALEVVLLDADRGASLSREALGAFHSSRLGRRVTPVVVAARRDGQTWLFGPNVQAAVVGPLPSDQARRMLQSALDEPSGIAARQRLAAMYSAIEGTTPGVGDDFLPGIANGGLFATHELAWHPAKPHARRSGTPAASASDSGSARQNNARRMVRTWWMRWTSQSRPGVAQSRHERAAALHDRAGEGRQDSRLG